MNNDIIEVLDNYNPRTSWNIAVKWYSLKIVRDAQKELTPLNYHSVLLRDCKDWKEYGKKYGLKSESEIAKVCLTEKDYEKWNKRRLYPVIDDFFEVQTAALKQAENLIGGIL